MRSSISLFASFFLLSLCLIFGLSHALLQPGVDDLDSIRRILAGKRVGLITNPTGVTSSLSYTTIDVIYRNFNLKAMFGPEHGLRGDMPPGSSISSYVDSLTNVTVYSIYDTKNRIFAPTSEMLREVDVLVCDLQDVGARYFTYISTMMLSMQSAAQNGKEFVVLDRFNPIGGLDTDIDGPILQLDFKSFIGIWSLPMKHAMTIGELAQLFNAEMKLGAKLSVIKAQGWQDRLPLAMLDKEGYPWINPSPNLAQFEAIVLYPGTVLFEAVLNVSLGRGTAQPFTVIGAPYIDPFKLVDHVSKMRALDPVLDSFFVNLRLVPTFFLPTTSVFYGQQCAGVKLVVMNRYASNQVKAIPVTLTLIRALIDLYGADTIRLNRDQLNLRTGESATYDLLVSGTLVPRIVEKWQVDVVQFAYRRKPYLLYKYHDTYYGLLFNTIHSIPFFSLGVTMLGSTYTSDFRRTASFCAVFHWSPSLAGKKEPFKFNDCIILSRA